MVQGLFALIVSAAQAGSTVTADSIDFIDEDNTRRIFLALFKQIANAACADTDEHFNEIRAGDGKERYISLAGNGAGKQGFTGSRRAYQQHTLRNAAAKLLKFLRLAKKFNNLLELFLRLIHAGDVLKRHFLLLGRMKTGTALAETERLIAAPLHLPHHEDPKSEEQDKGNDVYKDRNQIAAGGLGNCDVHALFLQRLINVGIVQRQSRLQGVAIGCENASDFSTIHIDGFHVA